MYRFWLFVCYCFLYRPNLFLRAQSWTGLNLYPFPIADSDRVSVHLPLFRVSASSPQHLIFVSVLLSCPFTWAPCRSKAFGQAPLWVDDAVSGPEYFGPQTHPEGQGLITLLQPSCWILDLLSHHSMTKRIETLQSLGHFLPVHWKCNVTWSYA